MIEAKSKVTIHDKLLLSAIFEAAKSRLEQAGEVVRDTAKNSIKIAPVGKASPKGTPPHTHKGKKTDYKLKNSIQSALDPYEKSVVIGTAGVGKLGQMHEFGNRRLPKRPFMAPALQECMSRLPRMFSGLNLRATRAGRELMTKREGAQ